MIRPLQNTNRKQLDMEVEASSQQVSSTVPSKKSKKKSAKTQRNVDPLPPSKSAKNLSRNKSKKSL
jgi:hypothetical protein